MYLILIQILIGIWSWSRSRHGSDSNPDPDMDPILIQILIWIWSWSRSRFGSATSSFVSPRPIFIEALAGEMPWREVRASGVKARQHLFCCSQPPNCHWCSHTAFRIMAQPSSLNIFLPQYIFQYIPASIYFSMCQCSHTAFQIIFQPSSLNLFLQGGLWPDDLCVHKLFTYYSMWQISVRITYHSHVAHQCQNSPNIFLVSISVDLVMCQWF